MKRRTFILSIAAAIFFTMLAFSGVFCGQKNPLSPCELFNRADAGDLFKESVSEGKFRKTSFPAGESCRYIFTKKGGSYGVTVKISTTVDLQQEGMFNSAADSFTRQKKALASSGYGAKKLRELPNLGDAAFWNGQDLWLLKGNCQMIITVNSFLAGSFKNREAMDKAWNDQDLAFSQKVALKALSRMK